MPIDFAALAAKKDAERRATMSPAQYAAYQARFERRLNREKNAVKLDGEERYNYRDGSNSYVRTRSVSFVIEPCSARDPKLVLRCLNGITGHEHWYAEDIFEIISGNWAAGRTRFLVCGGADGRRPELSVSLDAVRELLCSALAQA